MRFARTFSAILVVGLLFSVGCSSNNKGKIEGTKWTSQATSMKDKKSGQMVNLPQGSMQLEFGSDGRLVYSLGGLIKLTGKYSLGMGDNVTFNMDEKLGDSKTHVEKISINGDQLTMKDSDGSTVTFTKVK